MKRLICLVFALTLCFSVCSCSNKETNAPEREEVVINIPTDNTVNGYRTETPDTDTLPDTITADKVQVGSIGSVNNGTSQSNNTQDSYCASINSNVFHKADCSSVAKIKEENRFYSKDRNYFVSNEFKPCKKCNP